MPRIQIGSESEGLVLVGNHDDDFLRAELTNSGLTASINVWRHYAVGYDDLVTFFAQLERDWRGWEGERTWRSLEGEFEVSAAHIRSHVRLRVRINRQFVSRDNDGWCASGDVVIDPGEELSAAVRGIAALSTGK